MTKITNEIDELEREKTYFANMMRLKELKIKRIKRRQDLETIEDEISKLEASLEKMTAPI